MHELWPEGAPGARGDGDEDRPALTLFPVPAAAAPVVIVCPGGGYAVRAPHEADPIARWLNTLGVSAAVLRYRVAPYRHPRPLQDLQRASRLVRHRSAQWRLDPARVGILGFSAGGHLCATAATLFDHGDPAHTDPVERQSCRPDFQVLCYPVVSMSAPYAHAGSRANLLGPESREEDRRRLSPELQVSPETPPAFVWTTADDPGVDARNALGLCDAFARSGIPYELHVYAHGRHGLGLAESEPAVADWTRRCAVWLEGLGAGRVPA